MDPSPLTSPKPAYKHSENSPNTRLVSIGSGDEYLNTSMPGVPPGKVIRPRSISRGKSGIIEDPSTPASRSSSLRTSDPSPTLSSTKSFRVPRDESPAVESSLGGRRGSFMASREAGGSKIYANIQVAIRCRPLSEYERKSGLPSVVTCDTENNSVKVVYGANVSGKKPPKHMAYDKVFGLNSKQDEVYDSVVQPIVEEALVGFNCTVFAYGPTGTGKTYTMEGDITSEENCGIIVRAGKYLLETLQGNNADFTLKASFLEIYNEELEDLLSFTNDKRLRLCEDLKRGVICQHLEEFPIVNTQDIYELLRRGIANRQSHSTSINLSSSRSHAIFSYRISIKESDLYGEEIIKTGQLNLVDLAGSECIGRSGATNERAREAGSINQSLLTLGRVITALVDHHGHIPYRDSKLTRLLQESLGGKTKTCIIATISPSQLSVEDTLSTLDYAYRAKNIKNQPTVNLQIQQKVVMKEYSAEIETLKSLLSLARDKNGVYLDPAEFTRMEAKLATQDGQLQELELTLRQREDEINELQDVQNDLMNRNNDLRSQLEATQAALEDLQGKHHQLKLDLHETVLDLKSTEAVVDAQVETETALTAQGQELIRDVTARQNDVDTLLSKVDRMSEVESDRSSLVTAFLSSLTNSSSEILTSVQQLSSQSTKNAAKLHTGMEQILLCSKDTCESLQGSINASLAELKEEARSARDSMNQSCEELNANLTKTNQMLESTLRQVQGQLTSWLNDTNDNLLVALKHIDSLQHQVDESSKHISAHCASLKQSSIGFNESQEAMKADITRNAVNLKLEFKKKLDAYKAAAEANAAETDALLKNKASLLEQAVSSMLKDLIATHSESSAAAQAFAADRIADIETQVNLGVNQAIAGVAIMQTANAEHSALVVSMSDACKGTYAAHVEAVTQPLAASVQILNDVTTNAAKKSAELDSSIDSLLKDIDAAIDEGHNVVKAAQRAGEQVVTDVDDSVARVNEDAQQFVDSFMSVMTTESDSISKELNKHFKALEGHTSTQSEALNTIRTKNSTLGEKLTQLVVAPTGNTPEKTYFRKRAPLASTRDHTVIKKEQREWLLQKLQEVSPSNGGGGGAGAGGLAVETTLSPHHSGSPGRSPQASPLHLYDRGSSPRSTPTIENSSGGGSGEKQKGLKRTNSHPTNKGTPSAK